MICELYINCTGTIRELTQISHHTFASLLTVGLLANCTSVAFNIVFSSKIVAWD